MKRILLKHVGNMGDLVFFIPPVLETLKRKYPDSEITFVTAWGFKDKHGRWGKRNQDGFCLNLLIPNPSIDQLVHWHDTALSLDSRLCHEDGQWFPTWNREYFDQQKRSGAYDIVQELDFGVTPTDNPIQKMYEALGLTEETYTNYQLTLTAHDKEVAATVLQNAPHPRIVFLEGLAGSTTRGWDPAKTPFLAEHIQQKYGVSPFWFGGKYIPWYQGRKLTLRENIALLTLCDVGIGVLSGPLHFAAAVGLPTLTLFGDHPLHRAAPAYFLNRYIDNPRRRHRTLIGPADDKLAMLKSPTVPLSLTSAEQAAQNYRDWTNPGRSATKSCLAVITVEEVLTVLQEMI